MTGSDVVEETIRLLLSGQREPMNKLANSVLANATSLQFVYDLGAIQADALLEIDTEIYRVWSVNTGTKTAVVEPHMQGTTTSTHSNGALARVNPRISRFAAFKAMNDEIRALSSPALGLYAVKTLEFVYSGAVTDYDLDLTATTHIFDVLDVRMDYPGPEKHWLEVPDWRLRRNANTTDFLSGNALFIPNGIPGRTIRVTYSAPFMTLDGLADNLETFGLIPASMQDIIAMGTLLRLGAVREIKRNFTEAQGDSRRAGEVPPQAVGNSFSYVRAQREARIREEAARLLRDYGPRKRP